MTCRYPARVSVNLPVCFILAYRPPDATRLQAPPVAALPQFSQITLHDLTAADAEQLIRAKLAQLYPERGGGLPTALVTQLTAKAQGNPFYLEELLNYLHDRDISPYDQEALKSLELPNSLHTLVLSRMDQLSESQKVTLKVASIIGRLFPFAWLQGYYPALGAPEAVKGDLSELARLDLTPLDTPEPELAYLFKHIVTQEVPTRVWPTPRGPDCTNSWRSSWRARMPASTLTCWPSTTATAKTCRSSGNTCARRVKPRRQRMPMRRLWTTTSACCRW